MGRTFARVVLCSTDDFPAQTNDKIKGWVEHNGGTFTKEMNPQVTHLLASKMAWKRYTPIVKAARRLKTVKIVRLEWLEDSLLTKSRRPLKTDRYDWSQRSLEKFKKAREAMDGQGDDAYDVRLPGHVRNVSKDEKIERAGVALDKACLEFEAKMKAAGYHLYTDQNRFTYSVNLIRSDIHANHLEQHRLKVRPVPSFSPFDLDSSSTTRTPCPLPLTFFSKPLPFSSYPAVSVRLPNLKDTAVRVPDPWAMCLQLYETNKTPRTYAAVSTHLNISGKIAHDTVAPKHSTFDLSKDAFRLFFKLRTGVEWESGPRIGVAKMQEMAKKERTLSHDGAGDWTYELDPPAEAWKSSGEKDHVTALVNGENAGSKWDVQAKTPESGWR